MRAERPRGSLELAQLEDMMYVLKLTTAPRKKTSLKTVKKPPFEVVFFAFMHSGVTVRFHRPHPQREALRYQA
jgi:hypothetical protein